MPVSDIAKALGGVSVINRERLDARAEARALRLLYRAHGRWVPTAPRQREWLPTPNESETT
jgi:hypothetical protein